eukprot:CAMPEP_0114282440 /NCGR_PEP_ID=MMETSP0059-20121206/3562_1 /TAXON_ID=36894 /ORGANISM="Pyramimonas parkeae, Strain CCMP726" /LENGTH=36 /DNA_ID= /DNA_START= /DNA_END= /DNA_ORIENTATION=
MTSCAMSEGRVPSMCIPISDAIMADYLKCQWLDPQY